MNQSTTAPTSPNPDLADSEHLAAADLLDDLDPETDQDPRHQRRIQRMKRLFAWSFEDNTPTAPIEETPTIPADSPHAGIARVVEKLPEIDAALQSVATERPLHDINRVDLAILRTIFYEYLTNNTPRPVLIDEGVKLAKEFSMGNSPKFVNAVLANVLDRGTHQSA